MSRAVDQILESFPAGQVVRADDLARLSRRTDPETSYEAARRIEASGRRLSHKDRLLLIVFRQPGKTAGEYAAITQIDRVEVGRRLPDLKGDGLIEQSTARICQVHGTRMMTWRPATQPEETQTELF